MKNFEETKKFSQIILRSSSHLISTEQSVSNLKFDNE